MTNPNSPYNSGSGDSNIPAYGAGDSNIPAYGSGFESNAQAAPNGTGAAGTGAGAGYGAFDQVPYAASLDTAPVGKNPVAPWALGLGILALLSLVVIVPPFILGPIGIIVAIVALVKGGKRAPGSRRTAMSVIGLVLSILSIAGAIAIITGLFAFIGQTGAEDCMNLPTTEEIQNCVIERIENFDGSTTQS